MKVKKRDIGTFFIIAILCQLLVVFGFLLDIGSIITFFITKEYSWTAGIVGTTMMILGIIISVTISLCTIKKVRKPM